MDIFKRNTPLDESPHPDVFVAVVSAEGSELPSFPWVKIVELSAFRDLVTPHEEPVIVAVPDDEASMQMVRLVANNAGICGVSLIRVSNLTDYVPSALADSTFWSSRVVDFNDWRGEVDEAAREAELARRAGLSSDEKRLDSNARKDGSFKKLDVVDPSGPADTDTAEDLAPIF